MVFFSWVSFWDIQHSRNPIWKTIDFEAGLCGNFKNTFYTRPLKHNIYNVVIWFGETFISLGECVINWKCYLIQRILSPGKVKVRSVLKLWSIFTLLSDLENAVIWSSQIDHSFGSRFFHYGFSFNSNSVVSVSYLVYVCYGPWLYRPWGRSADGREADGGGGGDRDPWS